VRFGDRRFTRRSLLAASGALLLPPSAAVAASAPGTPRRDFAARATFDALDLAYNRGNGRKDRLNEERGALAWDESYVLQAYVMMLETYRDTRYADKLVDHIDHVLATRDSERRVSAYPGRSMPVWRAASPYNVGELTLTDDDGRPVLVLRTAAGTAETISATVTRTDPARFDVSVVRGAAAAQVNAMDLSGPLPADRMRALATAPPVQVFAALGLDPGRGNHAVQRINDAFTVGGLRVTAQAVPDVRTDALPRAGSLRFVTLPYVHPVHTGMIVWPMARFARLCLRNRYLQNYRAKASEYLAAVRDALACHDDEVRDDPGVGCSWYAAPYGSPFLTDGGDHPLNYTAAMARAWREYALAAGDSRRRLLARALTRSFTSDVVGAVDGPLNWGYYRGDGPAARGWTPADGVSRNWPRFSRALYAEDISHGHLEVDLVTRAHALGDLEDTTVLAGLVRTFGDVLVDRTAPGVPVVHARVDGSGTATTAQASMAAGWLGLARYDRTILATVRDLYARLDPGPSAASVYASAYLNQCARSAS
jgi:hypothetical protein